MLSTFFNKENQDSYPVIHNQTNILYSIGEMLCLQYFYNKSQVVSCYWFKFEINTKIAFLL